VGELIAMGLKAAARLAPTLAALAAFAGALVACSGALLAARDAFNGISDNIWCLVSWTGVPQGFAAFATGVAAAVAYRVATSAAEALLGLAA
jgi:uncharacterized membrane protein HdeD (DUF308 family)